VIIDIIFLAVLVNSIVAGVKRGLIAGLFSLIGLLIGLVAAIKLAAVVASHLKDSFQISTRWLPFISFLLVFLVVVFLVRWCAIMIERSLDFTLLGWVNKLGGIIFFLAINMIVFSFLLFFAKQMSWIKEETLANSKAYEFIEPIGPLLIDNLGKIIPAFKDIFKDLQSFF
jgi:membrane protein required for colicin V production